MLSLTSGKSSFSKERKTGSKCSMVADLPKTGATSMTTEASADLTCCEESAANSLMHGTMDAMTRSGVSILHMAETFPAAATLTSASVSRSNLTYAGSSSFLQIHAKHTLTTQRPAILCCLELCSCMTEQLLVCHVKMAAAHAKADIICWHCLQVAATGIAISLHCSIT